jgi:UDP-N-acetylmuramate dehydrogenase
MNAGAYGREFKDVLVSARAVTYEGKIISLGLEEMGFSYRRSAVSDEIVFVDALFQGSSGKRADIDARMAEITGSREATQPVKTRTGGSTFKNPDLTQSGGRKAWQLIDAAGCRGLTRGEAQVSEMHCNFLINRGNASAEDIEGLGEDVRARVRDATGVVLEWEIKRIGEAKGGRV